MLILAGVALGLAIDATPPSELLQHVRIDAPLEGSVDNIEVVQHIAPDHVRVFLKFTVETVSNRPSDLELPIEIPLGATVVGLRLRIGETKPIDARLAYHVEARRTYERVIRQVEDPALLEYSHATETHHRLQLRVFPITVSTPGTVTLELVSDKLLFVPNTVLSRVTRTKAPRPDLGFGKQIGPKFSLLAVETTVRPEGRITALPDAF